METNVLFVSVFDKLFIDNYDGLIQGSSFEIKPGR